MSQPFTFVDLFAGIGGFHAALSAAGGECWFASEIDLMAAEVYERNWGLRPAGDIVPLTESKMAVPATDVLAAGFPCQPFSKSGHQRGMEDTRGTLFWNICRVLDEHKPAVILLENVRNLAGPRQKETWETIIETLRDLGYRVSSTPAVMSPHLIPPSNGGRPQVRERVFITGTYVGAGKGPGKSRSKDNLALTPIVVNKPIYGWDPQAWNLAEHLLQDDSQIEDSWRYALTDAETDVIQMWNEWLRDVDVARLPGFPIWADDFRWPATYDELTTPRWKSNFLDKNAELYREHRSAIDTWRGGDSPATAKNLLRFTPSRRKLEWQAGQTDDPADRDLWKTVLHFRPSGIRAKQPTYVPALVAITQTSIIGPRKRRLTPREAARLQGLPDWFEFSWKDPTGANERLRQPDAATYRQLGNGVNVGAAYKVFCDHVIRDAEWIGDRAPHLVEAVAESETTPDLALSLHTPGEKWRRLESGGLTAVPESTSSRAPIEILGDMDLAAS